MLFGGLEVDLHCCFNSTGGRDTAAKTSMNTPSQAHCFAKASLVLKGNGLLKHIFYYYL